MRHPAEPWALVEEGVDIDRLAQAESLFALSNGHIGLRGNLDEGEPAGLSGTYLNGFYESFPLEYGERGYGFAEDGQSVVNVTDGKIIRLQVEDEPLDVHRGEVRRTRAPAGLPERHARAPAPLACRVGPRGEAHHAPARIALAAQPRGDRIRGGGGGPADQGRDPVEPAGEQGGRRPRRGPARWPPSQRRPAVAPPRGPRHARGARPPDQALGARDGLGHGARARARR